MIKYYYSLTFTYKFEYANDKIIMAYANPYTYTDLQNDLAQIESNPKINNLIKRGILCNTITGTPVDLLTITSPIKSQIENIKRGVIFTARVHPGETVGSWIMKGVLDYLLSDDPEAICLRDNFIFKLVPMLNPDGVIQGNYRCSLAGSDLNRKYISPTKVKLCKKNRFSIQKFFIQRKWQENFQKNILYWFIVIFTGIVGSNPSISLTNIAKMYLCTEILMKLTQKNIGISHT